MTIELTNSEAWAVLVGAVLPFVISYLKGCSWDDNVKFAFAVVICAIAGVGNAYFAGQLALTKERALVDFAIIFMASQGVYKLWFEGTGINATLTRQRPLGG